MIKKFVLFFDYSVSKKLIKAFGLRTLSEKSLKKCLVVVLLLARLFNES